MATKIQRVRFNIPKSISSEDRPEFIDQVVEKMRSNAESGKGRKFDNKSTRDGLIDAYKKFPKYSKEYIASLDFKNAGKSPSKVDLTLSGDMIQSLDVVRETANTVEIGFPSDQDGKADGNIRGTYGTSKPDAKKARNFLGLTTSDYNKIVRKFE